MTRWTTGIAGESVRGAAFSCAADGGDFLFDEVFYGIGSSVAFVEFLNDGDGVGFVARADLAVVVVLEFAHTKVEVEFANGFEGALAFLEQLSPSGLAVACALDFALLLEERDEDVSQHGGGG